MPDDFPFENNKAKDAPTSESPAGSANKAIIVEMPNTPKGYVWIRITTGMSDGNYVEVTSGLTEGEEVFLLTTKSNNKSNTSNKEMSTRGMGGMPSGMGGMPSGGMGGMRGGMR